MILNRNQINIENDKSFSGGWMSIYKPKKITSFSALKIIKKKFLLKKIGFAGTLDPLASGVLPLAFGAATKTIPYLVSSKKRVSLLRILLPFFNSQYPSHQVYILL